MPLFWHQETKHKYQAEPRTTKT